MSDGTIRIKIGATLSREVADTFGTVEKIAERTGRNVARSMGAGGTNTGAAAMGRSFRAAATEADKSGKEIERTFARQVKAAEKASKEEYRAFLKAAQDKKRIAEKEVKDRERLAEQGERIQDRFLRQETRNAEREAKRREKIEEQTASKISRDREKFANRTSHRAVKFLFPNPIGAFGMASRIGHDVLRGAGVDFSVAGSVSRAVDVESQAQQLSNQGYRQGEAGPAGQRVSGKTLEAEARKVGKDLSLDPEELLHAQTKFLDVTGDLDASRKNMKGLAEIAAATNTDFTAMAEAAGNVSRHLEEGPDKAEKLLGIMRVLAGQGKVGSIEIKDFATQMAKIAAIAPKFKGDVGENITKLTTLAQLSRAEGGSASAAQAATSTARFVDIFSTPAREKKFDALGIQTYTDKNHTQLADPFEIIRQSLVKTKGDALKMADLFKSVMSQRAVSALTNAYNKAGGGQAGITAVNAQFATFGKESAIKKEEVEEANKLRQETTKAQAQKFQDELDETIASMKSELVPAMKEFAPMAIEGAHALADLVLWAAKNPGEAVMAAVAAAIARAGIESAFRAGIEKALTGGNLTFGNVAANVGAASLAIGALTLAWDQLQDFEKQNGGFAGVKAFLGAGDDPNDFGFTALDKEMDRQAKARAEAEEFKNPTKPGTGKPGGLPASWDLPPQPGDSFRLQKDDRQPTQHDNGLKAEMAKVHQRLEGNLRVTVTNPGDIGTGGGAPPRVNPIGRSADPSGLPASWR